MKKQLLLLSLSLLLASCGGTSDASQEVSQPASEEDTTSQSVPGADSSSDAPASSEPAEKTQAELAQALFAKMAETGNCTYYEPGYATTQYFGGDKGELTIIDPTRLSDTARLTGYGYARLANYGIVSYYYINDTAGVDRTSTTIASPNKNLTFEQFDNSVKELGECGKVVTFAESTRTHTLTTSDSDFLAALLTLDQQDVENLDYYTTTKATISLSDDGTEINVSYVLKGSSDKENYPDVNRTGMVIKNIGKTKNTSVESYLASNITLTAPTAWDADTLDIFSLAGDTVNVPFPAGATYAASLPAQENESLGGYLVYKDLGCGNISTQYGAALVAAGFTFDQENSGTESGLVLNAYTKAFGSTNAMEGSTQLTLMLVFQPATDDIRDYYPNGIFTVYAMFETVPATVTAAQVNTYLAQTKLRWAPTTNAFPTIDFGASCTKIEFLDQTEATEEYYNYMYGMLAPYYGYTSITVEFDLASVALAYYPTKAEAEAAKTAIQAALVTAGYEEFDPTKYPGSYALTDPAEVSEWEYDVDLEVAVDDNSVYQGYLSINFSAQKYTFVV